MTAPLKPGNEMQDENKDIIELLEVLRDETEAQALQVRLQAKRIDDILGRLRNPVLHLGAGEVVDAKIADTAVYVAQSRSIDFGINDLVHQDDFLAGLSSPEHGARNLRSLWERNLRPFLGERSPLLTDEALLMAENRSKSGIALTTVSVANQNDAGLTDVVSVHIAHNDATAQTLVVGAKFPPALRDAFAKANIMYVDRTAPGAKEEAVRDLAQLLGADAPRNVEGRLTDAFRYRNETDADPCLKTAPLADLLVSTKTAPMYNKYIVRIKKEPIAGPDIP